MTFKSRKYILIIMMLFGPSSYAFDNWKSDYWVHVGKSKTEYTLMSFFVLPNQIIEINAYKGKDALQFTINDDPMLIKKYNWKAPESPGIITVVIQPKGEVATTLQMFVQHPSSLVKNKKLNGYTIGQYPKDLYQNLEIYHPPNGFVEVTSKNRNMKVSPHYTLGQFLCKQNEGYPKYVVLQTKLLRKLEYLTTAVNERGIAMDSFTIMSGYRTPFYNTALKNKKYSRHQWGGAADVYVDVNPKDGVMDDLNGDGKITIDDAKFLWNMVESFYKDVPVYKEFTGGLGLYKANSAHGPFVHVDVRGTRARW